MTDPLYTARAHATGNRQNGRASTDDGQLDVAIELPGQFGGAGEGTNPEQLFAAGYASCFLNSVKLVAAKREIPADDATVDSEVHMLREGRGFKLAVTLNVAMPGIEREQAEKVVSIAHEVCPYSHATRGNIDVDVTIV
jgi:Ohr subfamily peroxiredoxin